MIGFLRGSVRIMHDTFLILECDSVGYRVFVPRIVFRRAKVGEKLELYIHHYIRDDGAELYGFLEFDALLLFEQFISVSGVGPRLAIGVLSANSVVKLKAAIAKGDTTQLTKVSGIGKKTAERIIVDLREKISDGGASVPLQEEDVEAIDVLTQLGYTVHEAREALQAITEETEGTQERVRAALAHLGRFRKR